MAAGGEYVEVAGHDPYADYGEDGALDGGEVGWGEGGEYSGEGQPAGSEGGMEEEEGERPPVPMLILLLDGAEGGAAHTATCTAYLQTMRQYFPVHYAASTGDFEELSAALPQAGPEFDINGLDESGRTPLAYAVIAQAEPCIDAIVAAGADINGPDAEGRTPLHWAASLGLHKIIGSMCRLGAWPLSRDAEGRTALHLSTWAESSRGTKVIAKVLEKYAEQDPEVQGWANDQDAEGRTGCHHAAFYDHPKHLALLVELGASLEIPDHEGKLAIHWTAENESTKTAHKILTLAPSTLNATDAESRTPLHLAVAQGNIALVDVLTCGQYLGSDCLPSEADGIHQESPLHYAVRLGFDDVAVMLLQRGADLAAPDENGATAFHYAAQREDSQAVETLIQYFGDVSALAALQDLEGRNAVMWAAAKGCVSSLELLARAGCPVTTQDATGSTALHVASMATPDGGNTVCVKVLLTHGAEVDAVDESKHTPLFMACQTGATEAAMALLNAGASVTAVDGDGRTPLHWAALEGFDYITLELLKRGALVDAIDSQGRSALHCASFRSNLEIMSVLCQYQANPNLQDGEGLTPLHWVSSSGNIDGVKLLTEHGAYVNHMEADGEKLTPLDYASLGDGQGNPHSDVVDYLLKHGAVTIETMRDLAAVSIQEAFRRWKKSAPGVSVKGKGGGRSKTPKGGKSRGGAKDGAADKFTGEADDAAARRAAEKEEKEKARKQAAVELAAQKAKREEEAAARAASADAEAQEKAKARAEAKRKEKEERERKRREREERRKNQTKADAVAERAERERLQKERQLLHGAGTIKQVHAKESQRLRGIRTVQNAVIVIQRAYREHARFQRRKEARRKKDGLVSGRSSAQQKAAVAGGRASSGRGSKPAAQKRPEYTKKEIMAALTIQLMWRRYMSKRFDDDVAAATRAETQRAAPDLGMGSYASERRARRKYITRTFAGAYSPPKPLRVQRPDYMRSAASPAVASFNFALSYYQRPLARRKAAAPPGLRVQVARASPGSRSPSRSPTRGIVSPAKRYTTLPSIARA